jgi:hypothetical protein
MVLDRPRANAAISVALNQGGSPGRGDPAAERAEEALAASWQVPCLATYLGAGSPRA